MKLGILLIRALGHFHCNLLANVSLGYFLLFRCSFSLALLLCMIARCPSIFCFGRCLCLLNRCVLGCRLHRCLRCMGRFRTGFSSKSKGFLSLYILKRLLFWSILIWKLRFDWLNDINWEVLLLAYIDIFNQRFHHFQFFVISDDC